MARVMNMEAIKKTYDDLFYKIALGHCDLKFISDLENFCKDFEHDKDYNKYSIEARSTMSMIYFDNEVFDKSYNLDLEFLQENPIEHPEYLTIIGRIAESSSMITRTDEVKEYINKFIISEDDKYMLPKLTLLDWYVFHYPQEIAHNENFEKVFLKIIQVLEEPDYARLPLAERIKNLAVLKEESIDILHQLHRSYRGAAPELRLAIVEEYTKKTPLKYFRDIMKRDYPK